MPASRFLAAFSIGFLVAVLRQRQANGGHLSAGPTWLMIAAIFAAVSTWLFSQGLTNTFRSGRPFQPRVAGDRTDLDRPPDSVLEWLLHRGRPGIRDRRHLGGVGKYHARDHVNGLNVGTYLPVADADPAVRQVGDCAQPLAALLFAPGRRVHRRGDDDSLWPRFGVLAALLYVTYPGDVFFSTVVMPDAIQAGWLSFAMLLIVVVIRRAIDRRHRKLVAAGVALGVCHLVRANDVILVPVALGGVAILSKLWKREPLSPRCATVSCCSPGGRWSSCSRARLPLGRARFLPPFPRRQPPLRDRWLDRAVGIEHGREHDPIQHLPANRVVANGRLGILVSGSGLSRAHLLLGPRRSRWPAWRSSRLDGAESRIARSQDLRSPHCGSSGPCCITSSARRA